MALIKVRPAKRGCFSHLCINRYQFQFYFIILTYMTSKREMHNRTIQQLALLHTTLYSYYTFIQSFHSDFAHGLNGSSISQSLVLLIKVTTLHLQKTPGFPVLTRANTTPPTVRRRGSPFSVAVVTPTSDKMTLMMKTDSCRERLSLHRRDHGPESPTLHGRGSAPPRYGSHTLQNDGAAAFMFKLCLTSVSRF